jgi:hypothetical protein
VSEEFEPDPGSDQARQEQLRQAHEEARLAHLALTSEICHQINGSALTEYRRAPRRGSAGGPGTYAYQGGLSELTVQFEEVGYERHDVVNLPIMVNDNLDAAVIFTSGNQFTGIYGAGISPRTRYKKGGVTHQAILGNRQPPGQDPFPVLSYEALPTSVDLESKRVVDLLHGLSVYLYLIHFDWLKREIRSEVSLPAARQRSDFVESWYDRIAIPAFVIPEDVVRGDEQEIDFEIE